MAKQPIDPGYRELWNSVFIDVSWAEQLGYPALATDLASKITIDRPLYTLLALELFTWHHTRNPETNAWTVNRDPLNELACK